MRGAHIHGAVEQRLNGGVTQQELVDGALDAPGTTPDELRERFERSAQLTTSATSADDGMWGLLTTGRRLTLALQARSTTRRHWQTHMTS